MVKFINSMGGIMLVADERVEEYKAMGFKPVADANAEKPAKKPAVKKTTAKKEG